MEKIKVLTVLLISLFFTVNVSAKTVLNEDIANSSYVIGEMLFTRDTSDDYLGYLTTEYIMLASKTIDSTDLSDMIIYSKSARGVWTNAITGEEVDVPASFVINYENLENEIEITNLFLGKEVDTLMEYTYLTYENGVYTLDEDSTYLESFFVTVDGSASEAVVTIEKNGEEINSTLTSKQGDSSTVLFEYKTEEILTAGEYVISIEIDGKVYDEVTLVVIGSLEITNIKIGGEIYDSSDVVSVNKDENVFTVTELVSGLDVIKIEYDCINAPSIFDYLTITKNGEEISYIEWGGMGNTTSGKDLIQLDEYLTVGDYKITIEIDGFLYEEIDLIVELNIDEPEIMYYGDTFASDENYYGVAIDSESLESDITGYEVYSYENGEYTLLMDKNSYDVDNANDFMAFIELYENTELAVRTYKTINEVKYYSDYSSHILVDPTFEIPVFDYLDEYEDIYYIPANDNYEVVIELTSDLNNASGYEIYSYEDGEYTLLFDQNFEVVTTNRELACFIIEGDTTIVARTYSVENGVKYYSQYSSDVVIEVQLETPVIKYYADTLSVDENTYGLSIDFPNYSEEINGYGVYSYEDGEYNLITEKTVESHDVNDAVAFIELADITELTYISVKAYTSNDVVKTNSSDYSAFIILLPDCTPTLLGDVYLDGVVNTLDLIYLSGQLANIETLTLEQLANSDVDGDGAITAVDVELISQYIVGGYFDEFPAA